MNKLWCDVHGFRVILGISFSFVFSVILFKLFTDSSLIFEYQLFFIFVLLFIIYSLLKLFVPDSTYLTDTGVRAGDIPNNIYEYNLFKYKKHSAFLEWKQIKSIAIVNKEVNQAIVTTLRPFLVVRSNDNKKYVTFIANPKGFCKTIASLGKARLLDEKAKSYL